MAAVGRGFRIFEAAGYTGSNLLAGECFYRAENYERAVRNWEEGGATQKSEYNRAKVLLLGYPDGLEYLEKAGEADRIITEWERAGKPRDRRWLKYVAPALEAKHQYEQAFVVYVWLDELVKVKACFEAASQGTPKFKLFTVLFQYFYRKKHFADAIESVEKYLPTVVSSEHQKAGLKFDVVYEIACSELTPDDLTKGYSKRHEKFIKEQVLSSSDWQHYLLMQQLGVALEKIGSIIETLEFYEQFVAHSEEHLCQFARQRWIATKKRQEDYARKQKQFDKASKTHSEMLKKPGIGQFSSKQSPLNRHYLQKSVQPLQFLNQQLSRLHQNHQLPQNW
jgi:tetratricopeptide (TPR) repeat protein